MIENHDNYTSKKVKINELVLDNTNPRLWKIIVKSKPDKITENEIIDYLKKYEKLSDLRKKIEKNGWSPPDTPWVVEKDGKYIVKEGNRRVAVLKILESQLKFDSIIVKIYEDIKTLNLINSFCFFHSSILIGVFFILLISQSVLFNNVSQNENIDRS